MQIIQKIIVVVLLSFTSLFSTDIVGSWQMDMPKTQEANPLDKMEQAKQLVVSMFAGAWAEIEFSSDGTFKLIKAKQNGIWQHTGDSYIIQASAKAPENKLTMVDDNAMKIVFEDPNIGEMIFYFLRLEEEK